MFITFHLEILHTFVKNAQDAVVVADDVCLVRTRDVFLSRSEEQVIIANELLHNEILIFQNFNFTHFRNKK